jgi:hypothetical protein
MRTHAYHSTIHSQTRTTFPAKKGLFRYFFDTFVNVSVSQSLVLSYTASKVVIRAYLSSLKIHVLLKACFPNHTLRT